MAKRTHHFLARRTPGVLLTQCWLISVDGPARSGLLYGTLLPEQIEEVAKATGLEVIYEYQPSVKVDTPGQKMLFEGD